MPPAAGSNILKSGEDLAQSDEIVIGDEVDQPSGELLAGILDSSLDAVLAFSAVREGSEIVDFECQLANRRVQSLFAVGPTLLVGERLRDQFLGLGGKSLFEKYVQVVETGEPFRKERFLGEPVGLWLHLTVVKCGDGFALTCRDIDEQKRAEKARRESERRFRLLAENMTDLVCLHDLDGSFLYVSPSSKRILGFSPEELKGEISFEYIHPDDRDRIKTETIRQVKTGNPFSKALYRVWCKDEQYKWLETTHKPIQDQNGKVFRMLTSSRDVTERVRAEEMLQRANEELKQRNRELQDFAYVASHDLQEPLRKVRAFADLVLEDYGDEVDEMGQYYLERMQDGARRMSGLISDLLEFSRITTKTRPYEEVDLTQVAREVRSDLQVRIDETQGDVLIKELPTIEADSLQMRQLLQNLISNGLKFHREDVPPRVTVSANCKGIDSPFDEHIEYVCIAVEDNGIGFESKFDERIFTPFQRLHGRGKYEGTGMGLAICRRIAERHQGRIAVKSVPGEGSTFVIMLPKHQPEQEEPLQSDE